jgi:hypothetical protein
MTDKISYVKKEEYLIVYGDRKTFQKQIRQNFGGHWSSKFNPPGWAVDLAHEENIKQLISKLSQNKPESIERKKVKSIQKNEDHTKLNESVSFYLSFSKKNFKSLLQAKTNISDENSNDEYDDSSSSDGFPSP